MYNKNGWCITFYSDESQAYNNNRLEHGAKHLSWSPYDRLQITLANKFKDFIFPQPENLVKWCGVKQQLHLIPIYSIFGDNDGISHINDYQDDWDVNPNDKVLVNKKNSEPYGLYCLVTVRFSDIIVRHITESTDSVEIKIDILKQLLEIIRNRAIQQKLVFDCISFESLGSEDFALLLLANDIKTFSVALSIIRNQRIKNCYDDCEVDVFKSICTMTGFNIYEYNNLPNMKAFVKLNLKTAPFDFLKEFEKLSKDNLIGKPKSLPFFQGESSVGVEFNPIDLALWNSLTSLLNGSSDFYKKHIKSSRTYWIEDEDIQCEKSSIHIKGFSKETYMNIEYKISEIRKQTEIPCNIKNPVGRFIDSEYCRLLCLTRCIEWIDILQSQQKAFRGCSLFYEKNNYNTDNNSLLEEIQTVLTHINQACTPISEVPYHNHYYSGSFSDILRMYYGIINSIINIGKSIPRTTENKQSSLAIGIKFESVKNIYTTEYSNTNQENRIAIFHLPYEALHNFRENMILLVHEVFHYIAPIDRKYRNTQILYVWLECIIEAYTEHFSENDCGNDFAIEARNYLNSIWSDLCRECYDVTEKAFDLFDKLELYIFTCDEFVEENLLHIVQILYCHINKYIESRIEKSKSSEREKYKKIKEITKQYSIEYMLWRLISKDTLRRMEEMVVAIKEIFCDLFMCAVFNLDFKQYLGLFALPSYVDDFETDNLGLIYRINIIRYVLDNKFQETDFIFEKNSSWDTISFDDKINKDVYDKIKKKSVSALINNQLYDVLFKTVSLEVNFLKEISKFHVNELINDLKGIYDIESDADETESDIEEKINMIHKCMNSFYVPTNEYDEGLSYTPPANITSYSICSNQSQWVYSLTEYIQKMCDIASESNEDQLWYRGVCNLNYSLLPSLFRYLDNSLSLYANQVNILKNAYASTLQYPELWKGTIAEQMCCLQHYGMPTNLLDFSLDMLVALHFAVNPDVESDRKCIDEGKYVPVVYIFKPKEYARAIACLKDGKLPDNYKTINVSPVLYDIAGDDMTGFFPKKMDAAELIEHTRIYNEEYTPSPRIDECPVPIIIRRSNSRVLVQNGTFLAYSLNAKPTKSRKKYNYIDLMNVERNYKKLLSDSGIKEENFLEVVKIHPCCVSAIRKDLRTLGISTSKMYPELHNIFDEAKNKYKAQTQNI